MNFRELPPLTSRLPLFSGFREFHGKQEQMYALLAPLARQTRRRDPVRFHSMPEVSAFFNVALRTTGMVYRRMEQEGLLARIRGVGTVTPTRSGGSRPHVPVRGVVAVLNWLPGFLHVPEQRLFVMELVRALWERNFASALVFFHEEEKSDPGFADRIRAHRPNLAIWLMPGPDDGSTMNTLSDAGVHIVAIADKQVQTRAPKYVISWQRGMEAALRAWRKEGIRRVVVSVQPSSLNPLLPQLEKILRELDMNLALCPIGGGSMAHHINRLIAQPAGVVFAYDIWHARLCTQAPRAFARLLAQQRVLNCWSLPIEAGLLGDVPTDAVLLPWKKIIRRIASDVNSGTIFHMTGDQVFHAEWMPRVPAARIARLYDFETG